MAKNSPQNRQFQRSLNRFEDATEEIARRTLIARAADTRKAIQTSLKSGGRNKYSKSYRTSKPGEVPLTHGTRLKRSIRYEIVSKDRIVVGAPSLAGSRTAKTLEKGGEGRVVETVQADGYFERRKERAKAQGRAARRAAKEGVATSTKPKAKRAYYVVSESGARRRVSNYERFTSESAAKKGTAAPEFQRWRDRVQKRREERLNVAARPFVEPAAVAEGDAEKNRARWARIARKLRTA